MKFEGFASNVQQWARERGIHEHSTATAQLLKAFSEMGELSDAVIKDDKSAAIDAVGDVICCMVNFCYLCGIDMNNAMQQAWNEIKDRKGAATRARTRPACGSDRRPVDHAVCYRNQDRPR